MTVDAPTPGAQPVTVWTLEMISPDDLRAPSAAPAVEPLLLTAGRPAPELSRFFYREVGAPWSWVDRLAWDDARWLAWVGRPEHHLLSCWVDGVPAGYVELEEQPDGVVEVAYFGLLPAFIGQRLGGWLLTRGVERAWATPGARRVWVHTCSLDGPAALANYERRGFRRCAETTHWRLPVCPAR
jgi:GNAT superfamily N-acetyltransferase